MGACAYCFSPANIEHMYSLHLEDEWAYYFVVLYANMPIDLHNVVCLMRARNFLCC